MHHSLGNGASANLADQGHCSSRAVDANQHTLLLSHEGSLRSSHRLLGRRHLQQLPVMERKAMTFRNHTMITCSPQTSPSGTCAPDHEHCRLVRVLFNARPLMLHRGNVKTSMIAGEGRAHPAVELSQLCVLRLSVASVPAPDAGAHVRAALCRRSLECAAARLLPVPTVGRGHRLLRMADACTDEVLLVACQS